MTCSYLLFNVFLDKFTQCPRFIINWKTAEGQESQKTWCCWCVSGKNRLVRTIILTIRNSVVYFTYQILSISLSFNYLYAVTGDGIQSSEQGTLDLLEQAAVAAAK